MAVVSLVFFAGNVIITQAAVHAEQQPCKICKGPTVQHGEHIADSSGSHLVDTGFRVGSEPITQVCYWSYTIDRTYYSCVDGHPTFYEDVRKDYHSSSYCPERK